jgi:FAD/FMN-containing dehydrogenase
VNRCELLNVEALAAVNAFFNKTYTLTPTLFLEFHAPSRTPSPLRSGDVHARAHTCHTRAHALTRSMQTCAVEEVEEEAKVAITVAQAKGLKSHMFADEEKERDALWHARRSAYYASAKYRNDVRQPTRPDLALTRSRLTRLLVSCRVQFGRHQMRLWVTDVCVPLSRLAQVISETEADFRQSPVKLPCPIVGHVADGNFHCLVPFNSSDTAEVAEMRRLNERLVQRALAYEGTASGEHGVGMGKIDALYQVRPCALTRACMSVLVHNSDRERDGRCCWIGGSHRSVGR